MYGCSFMAQVRSGLLVCPASQAQSMRYYWVYCIQCLLGSMVASCMDESKFADMPRFRQMEAFIHKLALGKRNEISSASPRYRCAFAIFP